MDSRVFGWDLLIKYQWRDLFGDGLWRNIICVKYLKRKDTTNWLREGNLALNLYLTFGWVFTR